MATAVDGRPQPVKERGCKEEMTMKSDAELQRDVMNELRWEPSVDAENIGVAAKDVRCEDFLRDPLLAGIHHFGVRGGRRNLL